MYFAAIKDCDVADGPGVRVTLFVSGCTNHCEGCFQPETWDFHYGKPFDRDAMTAVLAALRPEWISGPIFRFGQFGANPIVPAGTVIEMALCAVFVGYGYYLCISNNATAVGMDTIALILHKKNEKIPVAYAMYAINIIVLLLGLATYGLLGVLMGIAFAGIQAVSLNAFLKIGAKAGASA